MLNLDDTKSQDRSGRFSIDSSYEGLYKSLLRDLGREKGGLRVGFETFISLVKGYHARILANECRVNRRSKLM